MDFSTVKHLRIPEGGVTKITTSDGTVLWENDGTPTPPKPFVLEGVAQDFWGLSNYYPSDQGRYDYIVWDSGSKTNVSYSSSYEIFDAITCTTKTISQKSCGVIKGATITFVCPSKCNIRNYLRGYADDSAMTLEDSSGTIIATYNTTDKTTPMEFSTIVEAGSYTLRLSGNWVYWHGTSIVTAE